MVRDHALLQVPPEHLRLSSDLTQQLVIPVPLTVKLKQPIHFLLSMEQQEVQLVLVRFQAYL